MRRGLSKFVDALKMLPNKVPFKKLRVYSLFVGFLLELGFPPTVNDMHLR